jgi:hypothetical protein
MSGLGAMFTVVFNLIMLTTKTLFRTSVSSTSELIQVGAYNPPAIITKTNPTFSFLGSLNCRSMNIGRSRIMVSVTVFITPENMLIFVHSMHEPLVMLESQNFSSGRQANSQ